MDSTAWARIFAPRGGSHDRMIIIPTDARTRTTITMNPRANSIAVCAPRMIMPPECKSCSEILPARSVSVSARDPSAELFATQRRAESDSTLAAAFRAAYNRPIPSAVASDSVDAPDGRADDATGLAQRVVGEWEHRSIRATTQGHARPAGNAVLPTKRLRAAKTLVK
jgi:hypothetical protein